MSDLEKRKQELLAKAARDRADVAAHFRPIDRTVAYGEWGLQVIAVVRALDTITAAARWFGPRPRRSAPALPLRSTGRLVTSAFGLARSAIALGNWAFRNRHIIYLGYQLRHSLIRR